MYKQLNVLTGLWIFLILVVAILKASESADDSDRVAEHVWGGGQVAKKTGPLLEPIQRTPTLSRAKTASKTEVSTYYPAKPYYPTLQTQR